MGETLKGGVIGGIERQGNDYRATSIDGTTGASVGDIPYEETLGSMAKTLGVALGVPQGPPGLPRPRRRLSTRELCSYHRDPSVR